MDNADQWYFSKEALENTPSRRCGIDAPKELSYRQQAANFIQDMGQRLQVSQLCINTGIVYMHRFYMFHPFNKIHRNNIAITALFLAAKVEEQPRKLEHVIKVSHMCLHREEPPLDVRSDTYLEKQAELVSNENIMLQTLGFVIGIDHPHTYIVKLCQLVKASKDLAQTSYFMATNSLHMTTMCLQYKPTVVACVCIHLACKWSNWKIEPCTEGKEWYYYVDRTVTLEQLEEIASQFATLLRSAFDRRTGEPVDKELTNHFIQIMESCPNRLRRKNSSNGGRESALPPVPERRRQTQAEQIVGRVERERPTESSRRERGSDGAQPKKEPSPELCINYLKQEDDFPTSLCLSNHVDPESAENSPTRRVKSETSSSVSITLADYREKREKGRLEQKNAHLEIPPSSSLRQNASDKHSRPVINHEKPQHAMPYIKSEFPIHRVAEKSNKQNSEFNTSTADKFNHQSARLTASESLHQEKFAVASLKSAHEIKSEPPMNKMDHASHDRNKDILSHPESAESFSNVLPAPMHCDVEQTPAVRLPHEKRTHNIESERTNQKLPDISLHSKINKAKHQKHKPAAQSPPRNSHGEQLSTSQGNGVLKQSSDYDSAKSCSSKLAESRVVSEHKATPAEQSRVPEKVSEPSSKHERKEKHKHKHSSSKDKSNHNHELQPADQNLSGGLKITIPKDKIVLSGVRPDSSQKSNLTKPEDQEKRSLKIKLPKPKISCNDVPAVGIKAPPPVASLKLVLTKDKNAGSYSASHKPEKGSRKRDRSPKDHSSKNAESGGKTKIAKLEQSQKNYHQEGYHASVPLPPEQNKVSRHSHHAEVNQFNSSAGSKKSHGRGYRHLNDSTIASAQYVMPYGGGGHYQQYYSQAQTNISAGGYQNKMVHMSYDHSKLPPPSSNVPPLPKDPPPPLPPQPPPEL